MDRVENKKVCMNDTFGKKDKKRILGTQQEDLEPGHFEGSSPIRQ